MTPLAPVLIGALGIFGLGVGLLVGRMPELETYFFPPIMWPLGAALAFDLMIRPAVAAGRLPDLTMTERAIGVVGGGVVYQLVRWYLPGL